MKRKFCVFSLQSDIFKSECFAERLCITIKLGPQATSHSCWVEFNSTAGEASMGSAVEENSM